MSHLDRMIADDGWRIVQIKWIPWSGVRKPKTPQWRVIGPDNRPHSEPLSRPKAKLALYDAWQRWKALQK